MEEDSQTHAAYPILPSSSASSKQYGVALMDNELIEMHLGNEDLDTLRGLRNCDLQDLWKTYYKRSTPFPMSGTSNEEIAHQLVKYLLQGNSAGLQFDNKKCVKPYRQLSPFIASVDQFPDAYVLHRESGLPLCTISCQRYDRSVCKTIIGVVTQLRLLRHFADIDSCIGFPFSQA